MPPPSTTTKNKIICKKKNLCIFVYVVSRFEIVVEFCNSEQTLISKPLELTHEQNTLQVFVKLY
jgi:hypothetical protein